MRRRRGWAGRLVALVLLAAAIWIGVEIWRWPAVGRLATERPATTAFIERYRAQPRATGRPARVAWTWTPYPAISPALKRAVLVAEDIGFFTHTASRSPRCRTRSRTRCATASCRGGIHHHPAARQESLALPVAQPAAEGAGGAPDLAARARALQAAHSRASISTWWSSTGHLWGGTRRASATSARRPPISTRARQPSSPPRCRIRPPGIPARAARLPAPCGGDRAAHVRAAFLWKRSSA